MTQEQMNKIQPLFDQLALIKLKREGLKHLPYENAKERMWVLESMTLECSDTLLAVLGDMGIVVIPESMIPKQNFDKKEK